MAGRVAYLGNIVTQGLILDLDAAKPQSYPGTGTTWNDLSYSNNHSELVRVSSSLGLSVDNAILFSTGSMYLGCINGDANIQSPRNNQFAFDPTGVVGPVSIAVELWFKSSQTAFPATYLLSKPWNGNGQYNYYIQILSTSSFRCHTQLASGPSAFNTTNVPLVDGNWKQFVYWANSTQHGFYVNGGQYSGSATHNVSGSAPSIGNTQKSLTLMTLYPYGPAAGANPIFSITGSLANVKFYNRQLSAAEITQNYNALKGRYGL